MSTVPATLTTVKIHLNSVISIPGAEYLTLDIKDFYYGTLELASNSKVYFEIRKGMPSMWKQAQLPFSFTLVVNDLGVKYVGKETAHHLIRTLNKQYKTTVDWKGNNYLGLNIA